MKYVSIYGSLVEVKGDILSLKVDQKDGVGKSTAPSWLLGRPVKAAVLPIYWTSASENKYPY